MKDGVKGEIVIPAVGPSAGFVVGVPPVENDGFVFRESAPKEVRRGRANFFAALPRTLYLPRALVQRQQIVVPVAVSVGAHIRGPSGDAHDPHV